MKSGRVLIWKKPLKHAYVADSFSTATQLIRDCWMSRGSIVYAGEAVVSRWPHKMNLQTSVGPLEAIVFDWDEKQTQARWDSRPRGYTASMALALVKVTKIKDDMFAENNVCRRARRDGAFRPIWAWLRLPLHWLLKYAPYFPTCGSLGGVCFSAKTHTHQCENMHITSPQGRIWRTRKMLLIFKTVQ